GQNQARIIPRELLDKDELLCIADGIRQDGYVRNYETDRLHKDGKKILVQLTESPIKDDKGEVIGRSQIMRDITNDRMREQQLQHSERLAAVGHMAAGIAHEVGNPLTSISSLVQLMQRRTSDVFLSENLSKIREHIYRITKIVRDLVDFSRPTLINRSSTDVNELVTSAVGLLKHDSRTRNIDFVIDTQPGLPATMGVPDQLHQVLVNLLLNAVDAVAECDDKHIAIVTESIDDYVQIRVNDNGCGISPEIRNRVFEPFFTTKEVGKGTGLGLSVSHGIIKRMSGDISVDSIVNKGTTFTIRLPVKEKTLQHVGNDLNS
ncbi:MAG TPA: ATP-binding protein, partial [Balneolales bacterium]|nr:ATP-binding protein [Balneolales bacterium]